MTEFHRNARFQLLVAGSSAIAVLVLYAVTHNVMASMAGFALLALLEARALLRRRQGVPTVQDERDEAILQRSTVMGYTVLWVALVAWGVFVPLRFGDRGSVPVEWVAPVVWVAWWLVAVTRSMSVLVLDGRGE
jgi:hypothetical protein